MVVLKVVGIVLSMLEVVSADESAVDLSPSPRAQATRRNGRATAATAPVRPLS